MATEKKYKCVAPLKINWGRGRLNRHESFFGFAAKFCRLNCLKPQQFREFWKSLFVIHENRIGYMARILDEPLPVVKTVFSDRFLDWSRLTYELNDLNIRYDKISFCSECLAEGFHGNFHESNWLKKCPIHHLDLAIEFIPYSSGTKIDRYLKTLLTLLDLRCPGWELGDRKDLLNKHFNQIKQFDKFQYWRNVTENSVIQCRNRWRGAFGSNTMYPYFPFSQFISDHDQLMIMNKLGWIKPIPKELSELFVDSLFSTEIQYCCNAGNELKNILSFFPYKDLFGLIMLTEIVRGESPKFQKSVKTAIDGINLKHPSQKCNCTWGISRLGGLVNCLPGELHYYSDCLCPYEFAAKKLYDKWLSFSPDNHFLNHESWIDYDVLATKAEYNKIASIVGYTIRERKPILKLNWSYKLNELFNVILEKIVSAHISEIRQWLSSIEIGNPPNVRERFPPNIYLVQNQNSDLQLISWPVGRNQQLHTLKLY